MDFDATDAQDDMSDRCKQQYVRLSEMMDRLRIAANTALKGADEGGVP
jgi:hypothetical protein